MDDVALARALAPTLGPSLARGLASDFVKVRRDFATRTFERASAGKFVETFVQCLQQLATGKYDVRPNVDAYLSRHAENAQALPEDLRICGSRIARAMYTLRNKRNIAHKNDVDPNTFDLAFVHQGAAWIVAELLRNASGITMEEAGKLVELVQTPVGTLVEEIDGTRLVLADVSVADELLVLLHSDYPNYVAVPSILDSLKARSGSTVKKRLTELCKQKLLHGDVERGYRLTQAGHAAAAKVIKEIASG